MRKHFPSQTECLELLALALMVIGIQWVLRSWGWTALFAVGFVWNWAVLNGWVLQRSRDKKYRFSVLRGITAFHQALLSPLSSYPRLRHWAHVLPAATAFGSLAYLLDAPIPWWAALLGSLAFVLIRRELATPGK